MSDLRETPIRKALYRPNLLLGGDRKMIIFSLCCSAALVLSAVNKVALAAGILLAIVSVWGLRKVAKMDPLFWPIYFRYLKYRRHYAPYSRPSRVAQSRGVHY